MSLLGYPEWAIDKEGNPKPYVTGPSPVSQGLLAAGLSLLADDSVSPWVGGGGIDLSGLGRAGLAGMQQYGQANQNLQGSRKDYFDALSDSERQIRENQKFKQEQKLVLQAEQDKQRMIKNFPAVLESINNTGIPEFQKTIPMLQNMFAADPNK